jgi:hypothetical protein
MDPERQNEILEYVLRNTSVSVFNANIKSFSTQRLYYNLKKDLMRAFPELDSDLEFALRMAEIFRPYTCDEVTCKENDSKLNRMLHTYKGIRRAHPGKALEIAREHDAIAVTQNKLLEPQNRLIKLYKKIRRAQLKTSKGSSNTLTHKRI